MPLNSLPLTLSISAGISLNTVAYMPLTPQDIVTMVGVIPNNCSLAVFATFITYSFSIVLYIV